MLTTRIRRETVDLWSTTLDHPGSESVLDVSEVERADRFVRPADRRRFVAARTWLRTVLGLTLGEDPAGLSFTLGATGKPALSSGGIHFNLSHSGDRAVLAVGTSDVGVDIEHIEPGGYDRAAAAVVLSPDEISAIEASADQDSAFIRHWTRKEAYAKALGRGLEESLATITFLAGFSRRAGVAVWDVDSDIPSTHVAVATTGGGVPGPLRSWEEASGS